MGLRLPDRAGLSAFSRNAEFILHRTGARRAAGEGQPTARSAARSAARRREADFRLWAPPLVVGLVDPLQALAERAQVGGVVPLLEHRDELPPAAKGPAGDERGAPRSPSAEPKCPRRRQA